MVSISATNSAEHSLQLLHYRSRPKEGRCVAASGNPTMGKEQTLRGRPKTLAKCCRHCTCTMHISIHGGIRPEISEVIVASHRGLLARAKSTVWYGGSGDHGNGGRDRAVCLGVCREWALEAGTHISA